MMILVIVLTLQGQRPGQEDLADRVPQPAVYNTNNNNDNNNHHNHNNNDNNNDI